MAEVLKVPTSVTISSAPAFARDLHNALVRGDELALDLDGLGEVDLSFLQIVTAARTQAARSNKTISIVQSAPTPVWQLLERAGFLDLPSQDDLDFWFKGAAPQ